METKLITDQALGKRDPMGADRPSKKRDHFPPHAGLPAGHSFPHDPFTNAGGATAPDRHQYFLLVIYQSTLGKAASFIPGIGGSYLGFILPLSIVSGSLSGSGIAAQNLVRDIERGYFDKLLLTPVRRAALLLAPILAVRSFSVSRLPSLFSLDCSWDSNHHRFTWSSCGDRLGRAPWDWLCWFYSLGSTRSGSAAADTGRLFPLLPSHFLAPTFVPLSLLSGWLEVAAKINPITYVLEAMRSLLNTGWDAKAIGTSILACLILAAAMYALAAFALSVRVRRS